MSESKRFHVIKCKADELEDKLNNYEPYTCVLHSIHLEYTLDEFDRIMTEYRIVYTVVPDKELQESAGS